MALTITSSSYAGEHAGLYISAALKQAKSLDFLTVRENVNYKEVVAALPEDAKTLLGNLRADYTRKTQELASQRKIN